MYFNGIIEIYKRHQVCLMSFAGKANVNSFLTIGLQQVEYALLYIIIIIHLLHLMVGKKVSS